MHKVLKWVNSNVSKFDQPKSHSTIHFLAGLSSRQTCQVKRIWKKESHKWLEGDGPSKTL